MSTLSRRSVQRSLLLGSSALLLTAACTPVERDLGQLKTTAPGAGTGQIAGSANLSRGGTPTAGAGNTLSAGGTLAVAGAANVGGDLPIATGGSVAATSGSSQGGDVATAGSTAAPTGGVSAQGGSATDPGGRSSILDRGGASSILDRGGTGPIIGIGGLLNLGGLLNNFGGFLNNQGGLPNPGGGGHGGAQNQGGVVTNAGGSTACVPNGNEICNDGIDNDCNGMIDCPIVNGRYPEPGRACAGDDAWVQLTQPMRPLKAVECHTAKPSAIGTKPWVQCDPSNPTALKVYSMDSNDAHLETNDGVNVFEFRFRYENGTSSETRQVVYYAHSSLADPVPGVPSLECPPLQPDSRYFEVARPYLIGSATVPPFAATDASVKNPFIELKFYPTYMGKFEVAPTGPQVVKVLSLRHRFFFDSSRQLLLVTRSFQSSRVNGSCTVATLFDHDTWHLGEKKMGRHFKVSCDAIVLNSAGAGVCLGKVNGVLQVLNENSSGIVGFLQALQPPFNWPKSDPMMWQRLFNDRPARGQYLYFSDKCASEDQTCITHFANIQVKVPILPDHADPYFTSP